MNQKFHMIANDLIIDMGRILVLEVERYMALVTRFQEMYGL